MPSRKKANQSQYDEAVNRLASTLTENELSLSPIPIMLAQTFDELSVFVIQYLTISKNS